MVKTHVQEPTLSQSVGGELTFLLILYGTYVWVLFVFDLVKPFVDELKTVTPCQGTSYILDTLG